MPEKLTPTQPVAVAMIGTGDGSIPTGTIATTPPGQPNVVVTVVGPLRAIAVRFVNSYLTILLGLVTGALATNIIPSKDFAELVWKCAGLSVAGACVGLGKDLITVFGKLEQKFPLLTGSI